MPKHFKSIAQAFAAVMCLVATNAQAQLLDLDVDINIGGGGGGGGENSSGSSNTSVSAGVPTGNGRSERSGSEENNATSIVPIIFDQERAVEAVNSGAAVPAETVIATAIARQQGDIIDVHLILVRGFLLYELKVLGPDGEISGMYFYARNGQMVEVN